MKKVFSSNYEVSHVWAQFTQSEGRASSVFFYGDKIYSYGYHFCIANRVSENLILFNEQNYSVSTSKHKSNTLCAIDREVYNIIEVYNPEADSLNAHIENLKRMVANAVTYTGQAERARINTDYYNSLANSAISSARKYVIAMRIKSKLPVALKRVIFDDIASVKDNLAKQYKAEKIASKKIENERQKEYLEKLEKWVNNEVDYLPSYSYNHYSRPEIKLRIKSNENKPEIIETNEGAKVGVKAARVVWLLANKAIKENKAFELNEKIDYYTLQRIDNKGNVKIGCHNIKFKEMSRIAKILNWSK